MKKSIVALLIVLALIVLISPGIVGRIAERSVGESIERAAGPGGEVVVTAERFDRGWFSSEGRHRLEILDPDMQSTLRDLLGDAAGTGTPSLVVDTHLDHGLVPVSSMVRDEGTLVPGLGSAVSTLVVEYPGGKSFRVPGNVYSTIGLTGVYSARYLVEPGSHVAGSSSATWGATDVGFSIDPRTGRSTGEGSLDSFTLLSDGDNLLLGATQFSFDRLPGPFGIFSGNAAIHFDSLSIEAPDQQAVIAGPVDLGASASVDGERLNGSLDVALGGVPVEGYGDMQMTLAMRYDGLDGAAVAGIVSGLDSLGDDAVPGDVFGVIGSDLERLVAAGFEAHVDRFDFVLPQGNVDTTMRFTFEQTDPDAFDWTSALLTLDAEADLEISEDFVDFAMTMNPQAGAVVGMGYLRKQGDVYVMHAEYRQGLLTINGAPMPIPMP